ncbi:glycerol kinase [Photobacterium rosenbergii]|uniref:ATP:glycerol 3-phosphotransferase n=1 Tax=Photobacterium rosenbergii TaxID=294936 RepID=A0A2T3N934_9GAMM|nr:glycerol kinase GlpK [Photobacterium rosenbergii]PSW09856.1 glycerol kinase [Photobacterium rosenbergii]
MSKHILVIDAGTTGIRALIYNEQSQILSQAYTEFPNYHPQPDRVEQDAIEIWSAAKAMIAQALKHISLQMNDISCVGITNQRATTVVWDRKTGQPVTRAIVWQDTRTAGRVQELAEQWGEKVYSRTGWALAPVYSSLSLEWMLENVAGMREQAEAGDLAFGTIDSWLVYCLTGGEKHVISASNASVTGSYDLTQDEWYQEWLAALNIPLSMFPEVCDDAAVVGLTDERIVGGSVPISGLIADQHSALFAQGCTKAGMIKCTHGTGTFLDMLIGDKPVIDVNSGICCQIAWRKNGTTHYALEGYAGCTGSAVQWLRDGLQIIDSSAESQAVASKVEDNGGVYFVPALTGLSAPYWDPYARGSMLGITPGTTRGHVVRATLEGIVYSIRDFINAMQSISGYSITQMSVDGGAAKNDLLVQFQADQLGVTVIRPRNVEATSLGAALMAGLGAGIWKSEDEAFSIGRNKQTFTPQIDEQTREQQYAMWTRAVERAQGWSK